MGGGPIGLGVTVMVGVDGFIWTASISFSAKREAFLRPP
jgi:hypothetical protein